MFGIKNNTIEFLCSEDNFGVIPEPISAGKVIPKWFKALPERIQGKELLKNSTIKRCMPFVDAMSIGYIIPLAADVEITTNKDASGITWKSDFYYPMIETHSKEQISSKVSPNPIGNKPPLKFMNYWSIRVPKGYSILFVPPLNRPDPRFTCVSGLVDADGYYENINFPFFFNQPNFTGIIKAGTPLVQAIPIPRNGILKKNLVQKLSKIRLEELDTIRKKMKSHESHYRDEIWKPK